MSNKVKFVIDGKECTAEKGQYIVDAAAENGVYIPTLCHMKGLIPAGSCRICTCKVNGRNMAACTTPLEDGMKIENNIPELNELRKTIVEVLFVEGNHFCPACEKSGNCELQALGYRYLMMVPRFPYTFPKKEVVADTPKIYLDRNRCIMCKKCVRLIKSNDGKNVFAFHGRGAHLQINIDRKLAATLSDAKAQEAMDICPVGAILRKEKGFDEAIGTRKYDKLPIGSDIEKISN
ncbi:MAG: (2Fe-2S)-binding protein [Bacteroidales bacterium]|nr:(2Fe-2S)-binding protein [Bacteroidales bacterium]